MFALQTLWVSLQNALSNEILRRRVTEELESMSERELADLGISRCDIGRIARDTVSEASVATARAPKQHRPAAIGGSIQPV